MSANMAYVEELENDWALYLKAMIHEGLAQLHEHEQLLHDLYVTGEIMMEDVHMVVAGEQTIEDLVGETSVLAYKCVLCRDTGCEFCGAVE